MKLAYLPKDGTIRLRLSAYDCDSTEVERQWLALKELVREWMFADEDLPIEVLVGNALKKRHATIATAESCTAEILLLMRYRIPK